MKPITKEQFKTIENLKRNVHKQFPKAYLQATSYGYTIVQDQQDLSTKDILSEYCILPAKDAITAWRLAQTISKVNQNINRTHPLKVEASDLQDKLERIEMRRLKNTDSKKSKFYLK